jgi:signal transduction histidine kinase
MTLQTRLILMVGGVAVLLALPALYAAQKLDSLRGIAAEMSSKHGTAYLALGRFQARLSDLDRLSRSYVAVPAEDTRMRVDTAWRMARQHITELGEAGYREMAQPAELHLDSISRIINQAYSLIATDPDAATNALANARPMFVQSDSVLAVIAAEIDKRSSDDLTQARRISQAAFTTTLLALVACFFAAALLGTWATQTLIRPIHRLRKWMAAVAAGEFMVPPKLPYDRTDEVGDLARAFRAMAQQLADLDRMKADFMSIAAHELKTPINVIGGYAELIHEGVYGATTEKQGTALLSIQEQTRNLTALVNQLLDISRLEAGGLKLEFDELVVKDLFERLHRTFDVLAHKQRIDLVIDLDRSAPAQIPADAARVGDQVLGNLMSNALKFTPEGGRITVRGWGEDEHLVIEVSDTGEGMPADQLPHVFDKYFQIGEQARSKGAGLGLTIAHEIVLAHGGDITVESTPGDGTTFCITLPATRARMQQALAERGTVDD